jgi:hypothetical protein
MMQHDRFLPGAFLYFALVQEIFLVLDVLLMESYHEKVEILVSSIRVLVQKFLLPAEVAGCRTPLLYNSLGITKQPLVPTFCCRFRLRLRLLGTGNHQLDG